MTRSQINRREKRDVSGSYNIYCTPLVRERSCVNPHRQHQLTYVKVSGAFRAVSGSRAVSRTCQELVTNSAPAVVTERLRVDREASTEPSTWLDTFVEEGYAAYPVAQYDDCSTAWPASWIPTCRYGGRSPTGTRCRPR